jgi:ubiquinone biosynthesis protein Coq4
MAMLPSNVKWRKQHVRSYHFDHVATRCNTVAFGEFAIQAMEGGRSKPPASPPAVTSAAMARCGSASSRRLR